MVSICVFLGLSRLRLAHDLNEKLSKGGIEMAKFKSGGFKEVCGNFLA